MARKVKSERILSLGLFLAHDLLGTNLPDDILKIVRADSKVYNLIEEVYLNLFHENSELTSSEISNRFSFFHIKVKERFSDKIRYILQLMIFPSKEDWRRFPLPATICPLLYMLRPIRLLLELLVV